MRTLIQRTLQAQVDVDEQTVGKIGQGMLVLLGVSPADTVEDIDWLAGKVVRLRIFRDNQHAMNQSILEIGGQILVVSQFTLFADTKKGNRPSFISAASPSLAEQLYNEFCGKLEQLLGRPVHRGIFGAEMKISLINDGPVTIWIDSKAR
jgi:D-aminoacyl-tRNA deacylase